MVKEFPFVATTLGRKHSKRKLMENAINETLRQYNVRPWCYAMLERLGEKIKSLITVPWNDNCYK